MRGRLRQCLTPCIIQDIFYPLRLIWEHFELEKKNFQDTVARSSLSFPDGGVRNYRYLFQGTHTKGICRCTSIVQVPVLVRVLSEISRPGKDSFRPFASSSPTAGAATIGLLPVTLSCTQDGHMAWQLSSPLLSTNMHHGRKVKLIPQIVS